eukprot:TRINITY_DN10456_c0_g1_i1.p1 TRINITY_DN10456_c0_g1~~TRINITY_DN10456_c0_g1_i1.p1  ORF type:complete len:164 (+),score=51.52 TRINITY_DN10456_c0_g1_i1:899-1390(+)
MKVIRELEHTEYTYKNDFKGLSAEEAMAVGNRAMHYSNDGKQDGHHGGKNTESEPAAFPGGAHYTLDVTAQQQREAEMATIKEMEYSEYLYKERFKGLNEDDARKLGEEAQELVQAKPGEALEVFEEVSEAQKAARAAKLERMQARMRVRAEKRAAAQAAAQA